VQVHISKGGECHMVLTLLESLELKLACEFLNSR